MEKVGVLLTPDFDGGKINVMNVDLSIDDMMVFEGDKLFSINIDTAGRKFLDFERNIEIHDQLGTLDYETIEKPKNNAIRREYHLKRESYGLIRVSYSVVLKPVGPGPYFDFGYEENGADGSGITFLPYLQGGEKKEYIISMDWDFSNVPARFKGVWTYGEKHTDIIGDGNTLAETFYYVGKIESVNYGNKGVYWFKDARLPGQEIGDAAITLYEKMAGFFGDDGKPYAIFARQLPRHLCGENKVGGVALKNSFIYIYPSDAEFSAVDIKRILPAELVHNWVKFTDDPYGSGTWFYEGAAQYYSMVLGDRYKMLSKKTLLIVINDLARDYYENPMRACSNRFAGENAQENPELAKLPLGRGFFYFLEVDERIRNATKGKKSVDDVVLNMIRKNKDGYLCDNEDWLTEIKNVSGLDLRKDFESMQKGRVIKPAITDFKSRLEVYKTEGVERGSGKKCTLYQFR